MAAGLDPFVVLVGQHRTDEAAQRVAVVEDPDHVGAPEDLPNRPLLGIVRRDLAPDLFGERGEGQQVGAGCFQVVSGLGEFVGECVDDPVIMGLQRIRSRVGRTPSAVAS